MLYSLLKPNRKTIHSVLAYSSTLKMKATYSFETAIDFRRTTLGYIQELFITATVGTPDPTAMALLAKAVSSLSYRLTDMVEVEVTLRPTISRPVRLGVLPLLEQVIRCYI
jgi:hypothetical protein